ncbi:MAG: FAD:protein FMN transferase [Candidatus Gracilibacteria bacterium]|nr:FAD:protein FMN transferase [Candidatus Gracilibacteria bacterium]MDD2908415.1 FAD:protein FMN transferase [Candidatus Gracilibacteria bacterium]
MEWKQSKKALGTDIEISVITDDINIERRINGVFDFFNSFEEEFSRFLPLSSLSFLNKEKKLKVSNRFLELMKICKELNKKTSLYFNPLVDISAIGYSNSFEKNNFVKNERKTDLNLDNVIINGNIITLGENQNLDFGGIGKGYAVTLASSFLRNFGYDDFFINAGGDIYTSGLNDSGEKWIIGIENPFNGELMASVNLSNQAIATSGNYKRKWTLGNEKFHHILNPKSGKNNFEIVSVSIIGDNCTETDAYTKAVYNMNIEDSINFIENNNLSGIITISSGKSFFSKDFVEKFDVKFY